MDIDDSGSSSDENRLLPIQQTPDRRANTAVIKVLTTVDSDGSCAITSDEYSCDGSSTASSLSSDQELVRFNEGGLAELGAALEGIEATEETVSAIAGGLVGVFMHIGAMGICQACGLVGADLVPATVYVLPPDTDNIRLARPEMALVCAQCRVRCPNCHEEVSAMVNLDTGDQYCYGCFLDSRGPSARVCTGTLTTTTGERIECPVHAGVLCAGAPVSALYGLTTEDAHAAGDADDDIATMPCSSDDVGGNGNNDSAAEHFSCT